MYETSEIDPTEAQFGKGETLARWRADLDPRPSPARTNGIGVAAMQLRAESLGCNLTIQAQESGGTAVRAPLRRTPRKIPTETPT